VNGSEKLRTRSKSALSSFYDEAWTFLKFSVQRWSSERRKTKFIHQALLYIFFIVASYYAFTKWHFSNSIFFTITLMNTKKIHDNTLVDELLGSIWALFPSSTSPRPWIDDGYNERDFVTIRINIVCSSSALLMEAIWGRGERKRAQIIRAEMIEWRK
jgi:hypothetical protein